MNEPDGSINGYIPHPGGGYRVVNSNVICAGISPDTGALFYIGNGNDSGQSPLLKTYSEAAACAAAKGGRLINPAEGDHLQANQNRGALAGRFNQEIPYWLLILGNRDFGEVMHFGQGRHTFAEKTKGLLVCCVWDNLDTALEQTR